MTKPQKCAIVHNAINNRNHKNNYMKRLITLLCSLVLFASTALPCNNPCWLNKVGPQGTTNQQKLNWIARNGADVARRLQSHFGWPWSATNKRVNTAFWEHLRLLLDAQCERGYALTPDEKYVRDHLGLVDCRPAPPTPTPTPRPSPTATPKPTPTPVPCVKPAGTLTVTPNHGVKPLTVTIKWNLTGTGITKRLLFFGDGTPGVLLGANAGSRVHVYNGVRSYTVMLQVTGKCGLIGRTVVVTTSAPTPTPTPRPSATPTPTPRPSPTPTPPSPTPTPSPTPSPTATPTATPTPSTTPSPTPTPTPSGCTFTQGYWKTHGKGACQSGNNGNEWPVDSLQLGNVNYTQDELCSILNEDVNGNCLISVAHQLIAAKLNIANGANGECIAQTIAEVDTLIGNLVVPPVGSGHLDCNISGYIEALTNFNEGNSECAPHCGDNDPQPFLRTNPCVQGSPAASPAAMPVSSPAAAPSGN